MSDRPYPNVRVFRYGQRPEVIVEIEGRWYDGELRMWVRREDGWWADVGWSADAHYRRIGSFPAAKVQPLLYCPWFRGQGTCLHGCERAKVMGLGSPDATA